MGLVYLSLGSLSLLMFFFAAPLCSIFQLTPRAAAMAAEVLRWCAVFNCLVWPLSFTLPNALRAAGDAVFTMAVSLASMFLFRVCFSYVLSCSWGMDLGLLGVWIAMILDWLFRILCFSVRYLSGGWQRRYLRQAGERVPL